MTQEPGKRIVSRSLPMGVIGRFDIRTLRRLYPLYVVPPAICFFAGVYFSMRHKVGFAILDFGLMFVCSLFMSGLFFMLHQSVKATGVIRDKYFNTLPAPDSLVRASQESVQAQETILLRAASKGVVEKHEEELLRATTGRQE